MYKWYEKIIKIPYFIIIILMIVVAPLGVWFFVTKASKEKKKIYNKSRTLTWIGIFILFLIGVGIFYKIKEIIELHSSGMSLDMISIFPENIWLYIIGMVMCISYLIGAKKLMKHAKICKKYIKYINLKHEIFIKKISKELSLDINEVKENIKELDKCGYLVPLEICDEKNKIIYKNNKSKKIVTENPYILENKKVQCSRCGTLVCLKFEEYVECDFCGHGMIKENNQ